MLTPHIFNPWLNFLQWTISFKKKNGERRSWKEKSKSSRSAQFYIWWTVCLPNDWWWTEKLRVANSSSNLSITWCVTDQHNLFLPMPSSRLYIGSSVTSSILVRRDGLRPIGVYIQPGAMKLVLWRHWMHVTQVHSVMSEDQFHCTRLYYAEVCVAQSTGIIFLVHRATDEAVGFLNEIQLFSSDSDLHQSTSCAKNNTKAVLCSDISIVPVEPHCEMLQQTF